MPQKTKALVFIIILALFFAPALVYAEISAINQHPELPTGCEATALTMLLNWAGVNAGKEEVVRKIPWGPRPQNGVGANPQERFVGDPFSITGFGVFDVPIYKTLDSYMPGLALNLTGKPFGEILKAVESGRPVVIWITRDLEAPRRTRAWRDEKGRTVVWLAPEHAVLLISFDSKHAVVNDPYTGETRRFPLDRLKAVWEAMGRRAVTVAFKKTEIQKGNAVFEGIIVNSRSFAPADIFPALPAEGQRKIGDKTYVPVREAAGLSGFKVEWDGRNVILR